MDESLITLEQLLIHEVINLHGHLMDEGDFDDLAAIFVPEVVYDVSALGGGQLVGTEAITSAARALGDANPLAHHVTNIVVTSLQGRTASARSKGLAVMPDGATGSVVYEDDLVRTEDGWRIAARRVLPRRRPLHRSGTDN